jgi:phosphoribosylanthranilate isomerase
VILLDAYAPVERGGTGEKMDWALGREAVERFAERKVFLAGGLSPDNVAAAVAQVGPHGIDVASGVESGTPGIKDLAKVRDFVSSAKGL